MTRVDSNENTRLHTYPTKKKWPKATSLKKTRESTDDKSRMK